MQAAMRSGGRAILRSSRNYSSSVTKNVAQSVAKQSSKEPGIVCGVGKGLVEHYAQEGVKYGVKEAGKKLTESSGKGDLSSVNSTKPFSLNTESTQIKPSLSTSEQDFANITKDVGDLDAKSIVNEVVEKFN